jgi:hypothetical protein
MYVYICAVECRVSDLNGTEGRYYKQECWIIRNDNEKDDGK